MLITSYSYNDDRIMLPVLKKCNRSLIICSSTVDYASCRGRSRRRRNSRGRCRGRIQVATSVAAVATVVIKCIVLDAAEYLNTYFYVGLSDSMAGMLGFGALKWKESENMRQLFVC